MDLAHAAAAEQTADAIRAPDLPVDKGGAPGRDGSPTIAVTVEALESLDRVSDSVPAASRQAAQSPSGASAAAASRTADNVATGR